MFVDKKYIWDKVPNHNLTIEITDVSLKDYEELINRTLHLQSEDLLISHKSKRGEILLNSNYKGKIYVNGLYVTTNGDLLYGYNIKPEYLKIGRDRNLVNSFDIKSQTSKIWREHSGELLTELIKNNAPDVSYLHSSVDYIDDNYANSIEEIEDIADVVFNSYKKDYSYDNLVFVSDTKEYEDTLSFYDEVKPIVVSETVKCLLESSDKYKETKSNFKKKTLTKQQKYTIWKSRYKFDLTNAAIKELDEIVGV